MENSFSEYRDRTGVDSDSGSEIIDNSLVLEDSFTFKTKPALKNHSVFVAESEDSSADDETEEPVSVPKIRLRKSSLADHHLIVSSSDDDSRRGGIKKQTHLGMSVNNVVLNSSGDEAAEVSPEILPKRRPPPRAADPRPSVDSNSSIIRSTRKNKRMVLRDSDNDNSIIIEHNKNKKMTCLKDTPLKVDDNKMALRKKALNNSIMDQSKSYTDDQSDDENDLSNDIINTNKNSKTPSRIKNRQALNDSDDSDHVSDDDDSQSDDESYQSDGNDQRKTLQGKKLQILKDSDESNDEDDNKNQSKDDQRRKTPNTQQQRSVLESDDSDNESDEANHQSDEENERSNNDEATDDEGPDEDQMVMSRATRMSIMGVIPKGADESDESDFIQSDESSRPSSAYSLTDLPDTTIAKHKALTPEKPPNPDSSRISCSPFSSPLHEITNDRNQIETTERPQKNSANNLKPNELKSSVINSKEVYKENEIPYDDDVTFISTSFEKRMSVGRANGRSVSSNQGIGRVKRERVIDDDVTIVESTPEVIALSSDDEEQAPPKSPIMKKSPKTESVRVRKEATMGQYLVPPSYPGQAVKYVKKHVRENELAKLQGLQEDLQNIRYLSENMDMDSLPDGGVKLMERLAGLEKLVREQGDKVANLVVEPDKPTAADMARDGFDAQSGLSWEELQKGSQAVQPRMFGKQAMATHMAERNHILERLRDLHESLASRPPESTLAPPPPAIKSELMPHQLHALAWLRWRETQSPTGGILADDMGLGKTITMISLIVSDKDARMVDDDDDDDEGGKGISKLARGGTLVVCPASLMQQWSGEVSKHCTSHAATVCLHHGANRATHPHRLATHDIVLTTYNILQRDNEKNGVLMKILWRRIILDEAHIVRNHKAATSMAVSALKGKRRWCLTGTPVQNKDLDLFALLKFLRCTPFDELTMWKKWIDNKSQGGQDRLSTIMQCILLRRTKVQLQERGQLNCLPERATHLQEVTLSKEEMNVYQKVLVFSKTLFAQFLHQRAEKQADAQGFAASRPDKNAAYDKMHKKMIALQGAKPVKSHEILVLLLRLRQVCCHCGLIAAMLDEETSGDHVDMDPGGRDLLTELNNMTLEDTSHRRQSKEPAEDEGPEPEGTTAAEAIRSVLSPNNPVFELSRQSSKIKAVMDCLHKNVFKNKDDKAVVVSQWTTVLRLVEQELDKAKIKSVTLSGSVPVPARPPLIDKLNDPKSNIRVMLLSLCAGGVGLNLCGANHLLLIDPHWNPQLEEQAQDRIYRVGQAKRVTIYRFMCVDTVEQSIRNLQQAKLELAENVLTGAKNTANSKLSIEDLKILFNMGQ